MGEVRVSAHWKSLCAMSLGELTQAVESADADSTIARSPLPPKP